MVRECCIQPCKLPQVFFFTLSLTGSIHLSPGAVTSPTILPPGIAASHEIGLLGSCRSDVQQPHHLSGPESDCDLLFEKDKCTSKSCVHLEDCEAAASAVAVAAISSEESGGNGLGTSSVSVSDTNMGVADIDGITGLNLPPYFPSSFSNGS